jgi:F0F1-type ATP synthase delta subunit
MYLVDIPDEFGHLVEVRRTAKLPFSPGADGDEEQKLISTLAKTGKKIMLEKKIDKRLIGGMIVLIDDDIIDGSVKHGLTLLEEQLNHIKVY